MIDVAENSRLFEVFSLGEKSGFWDYRTGLSFCVGRNPISWDSLTTKTVATTEAKLNILIEPDKSSVFQPTKLSDSVLYSDRVTSITGKGLDSLVYAR